MGYIKIDSSHAGGNIKVIDIGKNKVRLAQEIRDTSGWWFYWNFSVEGMKDYEIIFEFINGEVLGPWGPAVSLDGKNWNWLGEKSLINRQSFKYTFDDDQKVYFCFSIPYQIHNFEDFYEKYQKHYLVQRKTLAQSEQLRSIPLLLIGNSKAEKDIVFTSRHHACESPPNYLLEGLLEYLLNFNSFILQDYLIHYIPFVDMDGVENGDQGKNRAPHDHNRDYIENPIYRSTEAIMKYVPSLDLEVGIDFHSPYKWGGRNNYPFFVEQGLPIKEEIEKISGLFKEIVNKNNLKDKISYDPSYNLEEGKEWNQSNRANCSSYFKRRRAKLCFGFETPYFGIDNTMYTVHNLRQLGADFAKSLEAYLKN